jgi:glycosyltransferase involved in cell wall biosynthesis
MKDLPRFSIIIPVKNEAQVLGRCLESLKNLNYPKEHIEIILADGSSTDRTKDIAVRFGAKVIANEKQVVVSGRNVGFKEAGGDIVVFTDADCVFDSAWLKNSIKYFNDEKIGGVGGVSLIPQDSSNLEKAIDLLFYFADILQTTSHRQKISAAKEVKDIPGCNAFYRRDALAKVMPVDENLLTAEDVWMNFCLRNLGYKLILAPDAVLLHYRRSSLRRFIRQIYRFAVGRLQVGKKNPGLLNIFHIVIGLSIPFFLLALIGFWLSGGVALFLNLILIFFAATILPCFIKTRSLPVAINIPLVIIIFTFAWSSGFLKEFFLPLKDVKGR